MSNPETGSEPKVNTESVLSTVEGRPVIVLNPGHGNEPYILAAAIGKEVGKRFVASGLQEPLLVMPLLYGDRQRRIVSEENPDDSSIYFDPKFGELLREIMFDSGDYGSHIAKIDGNCDEAETQINQRYANDAPTVTVYNNSSNESYALNPRDVIGVIETGSRVSFEKPHKYFAFPELLSRVLDEAMRHNDELGFSESDMTRFASRMRRVEPTYSQIFIPWVSTFSYQYASSLDDQPQIIDGRSRIYTPPMKADIEPTIGQVGPGLYIMFSGTSSAVESNRALVKAAHEAGIQAYTPSWEDVGGAIKIPPTALADTNVLAIMGRSGWGTGWQAMQLAKPWLVAPYEKGDDPEIFFNNKTIMALKLGQVLEGKAIRGDELRNMVNETSPRLLSLKQRIVAKFGTPNGIEYMGERIFSDLAR